MLSFIFRHKILTVQFALSLFYSLLYYGNQHLVFEFNPKIIHFLGIATLLSCFFVTYAVLIGTRKKLEERTTELQLQNQINEDLENLYLYWDPNGTLHYNNALRKLLGKTSKTTGLSINLVDLFQDPEEVKTYETFKKQLLDFGKSFKFIISTKIDHGLFEIRGKRIRLTPHYHLNLISLKNVTQYQNKITFYSSKWQESKHEGKKLQEILNHLPHPIWQENINSEVIWANKEYLNVTNSEFNTILSKPSKLSILNEPQSIEKIVSNGQIKNYLFTTKTLKYNSKDPDTNSEIITLKFGLDRTDVEKAKKDLKKLSAGQNQVLQTVRSAIAIYGKDTRLDFYNKAYADLWELSPDWLNTRPSYTQIFEDIRIRRLLPEHADFHEFKKQRLALFTSIFTTHEEMMYLPDGTALHSTIVPHPYGGLIFILEDVTNKLSLEERYKTLLAVQKETLDNMAEGVAVFGADGLLKLYNPAYIKIWELEPSEISWQMHIQDISKLIHEKSPKHSKEKMGLDLLNLALERIEGNNIVKLPNKKTIAYATTPLPDGAMLNTFLDITETVNAQKALKLRNATLGQVNKIKSEFISNISSQLRTPLNTIMGFNEIIANEYFGELNEKQKEYSAHIGQAGHKLLSLINNILELNSIETGSVKIQLLNNNVYRILKDVQSLTQDWLSQHNLHLVIEKTRNDLVFKIDSARLKQILLNLISFTVHYTNPTKKLHLQSTIEDHKLIISLKIFTKKNISKEILKIKENKIYKYEDNIKIGLFLVKSFMKLLNGKIQFNPGTKDSTIITLIFPQS